MNKLLYKIISKIKKVNAMLRALKKEGLYDESIAVENIFDYLESSPVDISKDQIRVYFSS